MSRVSFNFHVNGITMGDWWQGVTCDQCNFNGRAGVSCINSNAGTTGINVLLVITNSQFDCAGTALLLAGPVYDVVFTNNSVFISTNGNSAINVTHSGSNGIFAVGNTFHLIDGPTGTFCIAYADVNGVILGNLFNACTVPVNLTASSSNIGVNLNRYVGVTSGSNINSAGAANQLGVITQ